MTSMHNVFMTVVGALALVGVEAAAQQTKSPAQDQMDRAVKELTALTERLNGLAAPQGDKLSSLAAQECESVTRFYLFASEARARGEITSLLGSPAPDQAVATNLNSGIETLKKVAREKCVAPTSKP